MVAEQHRHERGRIDAAGVADDEEIGKHIDQGRVERSSDSSRFGMQSEDSFLLQQEQQSNERTYEKSIFALCVCMLVHGWLLVSVFPYSGFLAIFLIPSLNEETAGSYAGLLASAFMAGRTLTSYGWGVMADTYGRRFVLFVSLGWSCIFSLLFGCSRSFPMALFWRFLLGVGNGILGTTKTSISELAYGNEKLETKGMGMVMGMWGWSFLVSPAISGALSEPLKQYPNSEFVQEFHSLLNPFPFILPNIVSVIFCVIAIVAIYAYVPETLSKDKLRCPSDIPNDAWCWVKSKLRLEKDEYTPLPTDSSNYQNVSHDSHENDPTDASDEVMKDAQMKHSESCSLIATARPRRYDTANGNIKKHTSPRSVTDNTLSSSNGGVAKNNGVNDIDNTATISSLWEQITTRNHLITTWVYAFVAVALDEAFPLYCISNEAGLGLSEVTIGKILSGCGLIFASCQYFVYSYIVNRYGLYKSIRIGAVFSGPLLALVPISRLLNGNNASSDIDDSSGITWSAYIYLVVLLSSYRIFSMVFFSSIAVATNRTVVPSHRGTMNGLSTLGGSVSKGLAPTFAGLLVAFSVSSGFIPRDIGGFLIFGFIGMMGLITVIMSFNMLGEDRSTSGKYPCKN